jgi:3-oxoacyl-[acyl-carrier protein] reductase
MARTAAPHLIAGGWGRVVNVTTSLPTMQRRHNSPYGVSKAAIEAETLIWAKDLEGTGVTVNSLIPGGAADTDFVHMASRKELAAIGRTLLPPAVMVKPIVWLASRLSDGVTGARFVGKLWDEALPPGEAAAKAREASVLLPVPPETR